MIPTIKKNLIFNSMATLLLAFFLFQGVHSAWTQGQTTDETFYSGGGYPIVRYNNYEFLGDHPPLISQIAGLPLLFLKVKFPIENPLYVPGTDRNDVSGNGAMFLYKMGNDAHLILLLERLPIVGLTFLLGLGLCFLGRELFGPWGSLLVLCLYVFDPNIIAHGSLFTTDMGVTVFYFFSVYALKRFFDNPSAFRAMILGLSCGLTFMSKISGLMLFPVVTCLFLLFYFSRSKNWRTEPLTCKFDQWVGILSLLLLVNAIGQKQAMVALGPICLLAAYLCFKDRALIVRSRWTKFLFHGLLAGGIFLCFVFSMKLKKKYGVGASALLIAWNMTMVILWAALIKFRKNVPIISFTKLFFAVWLVAGLVVILDYTDIVYKCYRFIGFGSFVKPLGIVFTHSVNGHRVCIEGSFVTCDWRYFFCTMAVKTPLLSLALAGLGLVFLIVSRKPIITKALIFIPPFFFLGASIFNGINIGLRHILPIYPFLFLLGGIPGAMIADMRSGVIKKMLAGVLLIFLGLFVFRSLAMGPDYLAYTNELVGGPEQGAKLVADSNLNWGQDNKRLAEFVLEKKIPLITIASEAENADIYDYYKIRWKRLGANELSNPVPGFYALSIGYHTAQQKDPRSWFKGKQPSYRVGKTFYVFEVPKKQTTDNRLRAPDGQA